MEVFQDKDKHKEKIQKITSFVSGAGCGRNVSKEELIKNDNAVKFLRKKSNNGHKRDSFGASGVLSKKSVSVMKVKLRK